jgi:ABC-type Fe3+ transport system permease subunit
MFVPSIILAYALIRTIGPNGTVDLLLNSVGLPKLRTPYLTPWGPVIGLVWDNLPLTVLMLTSGLSSISNSAIEAARDVGARPLRVFVSIILPRMGNSLLVTASFAVLGIFSAFTLP